MLHHHLGGVPRPYIGLIPSLVSPQSQVFGGVLGGYEKKNNLPSFFAFVSVFVLICFLGLIINRGESSFTGLPYTGYAPGVCVEEAGSGGGRVCEHLVKSCLYRRIICDTTFGGFDKGFIFWHCVFLLYHLWIFLWGGLRASLRTIAVTFIKPALHDAHPPTVGDGSGARSPGRAFIRFSGVPIWRKEFVTLVSDIFTSVLLGVCVSLKNTNQNRFAQVSGKSAIQLVKYLDRSG